MSYVPAVRGVLHGAVVLLLVVSLVPLADAQAPQLAQVQVDATPKSAVIRKSHGSTGFNFTVSLLCSGNPCTGQVGDAEFQITLQATRTPYPDGWSVRLDTTQFRMRAKETKTIPVVVRLLDDNPEKDTFVIGLSATAQPVTNQGALDPLLGGQLGQSSTSGSEVNVDKILNFGEQLTSWARGYMWPLLGAAVVLIIAGVVLVERKRGVLALTSEAPQQTIQPGRGASYPVRVVNEAKTDDRVSLVVTELPPEWTSIVPLSELDLRGGERTQMWITVRAPSDAQPGQALGFTLRAQSARGQRSAELPLHLTVVGGGSYAGAATEPPPPPIEIEQEAPATAYERPQRPDRAAPKRKKA